MKAAGHQSRSRTANSSGPTNPYQLAIAMGQAIQSGDFPKIEQLIKQGASLDQAEGAGAMTPLLKAAWWKNASAVKMLLANGARPDGRDMQGWSPMHAAASRNDTEVMDLLLASGGGVSVLARDDKGGTPLHEAASSNGAQAIAWLLERGADPFSQNNAGKTPGNIARALDCLEAVAALDAHAARLAIENVLGVTAPDRKEKGPRAT